MWTAARAVDGSGAGKYTRTYEWPSAASGIGMTLSAEDAAVMSDEALVERLHDRDVRALETLYDRHARALFSLAMKMLAEPEVAEEIVQETFLKLWLQPASYASERGRLVSWLLGIAHHRAIDRLRRLRLERRYSTDYRLVEPLVDRDDPADRLLAALRSEAVRRAVSMLPEPQRVAIELAYVRGMTQVEIAEAVGEPLGTIKTRLRLAMQKLRASLELSEMRSGQ